MIISAAVKGGRALRGAYTKGKGALHAAKEGIKPSWGWLLSPTFWYIVGWTLLIVIILGAAVNVVMLGSYAKTKTIDFFFPDVVAEQWVGEDMYTSYKEMDADKDANTFAEMIKKCVANPSTGQLDPVLMAVGLNNIPAGQDPDIARGYMIYVAGNPDARIDAQTVHRDAFDVVAGEQRLTSEDLEQLHDPDNVYSWEEFHAAYLDLVNRGYPKNKPEEIVKVLAPETSIENFTNQVDVMMVRQAAQRPDFFGLVTSGVSDDAIDRVISDCAG